MQINSLCYQSFNNRFSCIIFAVLLVLLLSPSGLLASGLAVQPATFLFRDVSVGKKVKLSVPLSIHNKDDQSNTYTVKTILPSQIGMSWPDGYIEIPETGWFKFEDNKKITVAGGEIGFTNMYIEIPGKDAYYNQKWVIAIEVKTDVEISETIALAVYPRFLIETESNKSITERPAGSMGISPAKLNLSFQSVNGKRVFEIYNNDTIPHTYTIRPGTPKGEIQRQILHSPTPSYDWLPDPGWILLDIDNVTIEAGRSRLIEVFLKVPHEMSMVPQKWETLLFITPDKGPSSFVRVLIEP